MITKYLKTFKLPNVKNLWGAMTANLMGDQLHEIALLWLIYQQSGSAEYLSLAMLAQRTPIFVAGLIGGVYSDRLNRFRVFGIFNLLAAIVVGSIPVLYFLDKLTVAYLIGVAVVLGFARCFGTPAFSGIVPLLVERENFQSLNGLLDTTKRVARSFGPGLGGFVLNYISLAYFFIADALSYLISAALTLKTKPIIEYKPGQTTAKKRTTFFTDLKEVWQYVRQDRSILFCILGFGIYNLAYAVGYYIGLPSIARQLSGNPSAYSYLVMAFGLGGLAGNILFSGLKMKDKSIAVFTGIGVIGACFLLMSLSPNMNWVYLFGFLAAMGLPLMDIAMPAKIQEDTKIEMIGRVFSLWRTIAEAGMAVGLLLAYFYDFTGKARLLFLCAGLHAIVVAVVFLVLLRATKKKTTKQEQNMAS